MGFKPIRRSAAAILEAGGVAEPSLTTSGFCASASLRLKELGALGWLSPPLLPGSQRPLAGPRAWDGAGPRLTAPGPPGQAQGFASYRLVPEANELRSRTSGSFPYVRSRLGGQAASRGAAAGCLAATSPQMGRGPSWLTLMTARLPVPPEPQTLGAPLATLHTPLPPWLGPSAILARAV